MRNIFLVIAALFSVALHADASSWERSCTPFTDGCLFLLASKEANVDQQSDVSETTIYTMAFHAGRLGLDRLPTGDLEFAPDGIGENALELLKLGQAVKEERVSVSLAKPILGFEAGLVAPYILPRILVDLSQSDVEALLSASDLPSSTKGQVIGKMLATDLNEGEYRFVNGQIEEYVDLLNKEPDSYLGLTSMILSLAEEGYTREAKDLVNRHLVPKDHLRSQDVLLYVRSIQGVFEGDTLRVASLASAIQSPVFRLEALGHLYALSRDPFIGKQYLSALYDFASPFSNIERRNLVLLTISLMD